MLMKFATASVATAFASMVFPVPRGPNKSIPLQGYKRNNRTERFFGYPKCKESSSVNVTIDYLQCAR